MMSFRSCLAVLVALMGVACTDAPSLEQAGIASGVPEAWTLGGAPLVQIGVVQGEQPYRLHDVTSATRLADGRIVVADNGRYPPPTALSTATRA